VESGKKLLFTLNIVLNYLTGNHPSFYRPILKYIKGIINNKKGRISQWKSSWRRKREKSGYYMV